MVYFTTTTHLSHFYFDLTHKRITNNAKHLFFIFLRKFTKTPELMLI